MDTAKLMQAPKAIVEKRQANALNDQVVKLVDGGKAKSRVGDVTITGAPGVDVKFRVWAIASGQAYLYADRFGQFLAPADAIVVA